jgi:hypothetical protein
MADDDGRRHPQPRRCWRWRGATVEWREWDQTMTREKEEEAEEMKREEG